MQAKSDVVTIEELVAGVALMEKLRRNELKELAELDRSPEEEEEIVADVMERRELLKRMMEYLQGRVEELVQVSGD